MMLTRIYVFYNSFKNLSTVDVIIIAILMFSVTVGAVGSACLVNGVCLSPNSVCRQNTCQCADGYTIDHTFNCGKSAFYTMIFTLLRPKHCAS
jgi:EB module